MYGVLGTSLNVSGYRLLQTDSYIRELILFYWLDAFDDTLQTTTQQRLRKSPWPPTELGTYLSLYASNVKRSMYLEEGMKRKRKRKTMGNCFCKGNISI